jgi:hypothetical protein
VNALLRWLRIVFLGPVRPPLLEEERFPRDASGRPDLTRFVRPLDHYIGYLDAYLESLRTDARPTGGAAQRPHTDSAWQAYAYRKGVLGQWGLIARGPGEALPYVITLLGHPLPEARQAGAGVLDAWVGAQPHPNLAAYALTAAEREASAPERDAETLSVLVELLGRIKSVESLPLLARVLRAPESRAGDVDVAAAQAVGAIAGESFEPANDPRAAADRWLRARGL